MANRTHSVRLLELADQLASGFKLEVDENDILLLKEVSQMAQRIESGEGFNAKPIVSMRDGRPKVDCSWMGMLAQVTPEQARSIGLGLIQTAAEAESDAAMMQFFKETGISDDKAAQAVAITRNLRFGFQEVVGETQEPKESALSRIVPFGVKPS